MPQATPRQAQPIAGAVLEAHSALSRTPKSIRERLRTQHLLLLTTIGEEGDTESAAEHLNVSRAAASHLLEDVEQLLGAQLFERHPQGIRANWYGKTVIRQARVALADRSEMVEEIDLHPVSRSEHVNIGAISGPAMSLVPQAIACVTREYPLVRLRLQVESSDRLLEALRAGRLEVMVGRLLEPYDATKYNYQCLSHETVCAVARKGHPLLKQRRVGIKELAAAPWIVPQQGSILRHQFDQMFREAGYSPPKQIIEAVSQMVVTRLLEETNYLAILSRDIAEYCASLGSVAILPAALACNLDSFGIVTRKASFLSPAAQALCDALVAVVAKTNNSRQRPAAKPKR
jgi:DNA-binding transcriptional LysR family regulator